MYDMIIIGAGPGGLTAGIYGARAMLKVAVIEKNLPGGNMNNTGHIANYPGFEMITGYELGEKMYEQAEKTGVEIIYNGVNELEQRDDYSWEVTLDNDETLVAKTVVIATGTVHKHLGVAGEELFSGKGVSYCAICDGLFFKDKNIFVVGGGDSAVEEGTYLTNYGSNVTLLHRRDELRASPLLQNEFIEKENTNIYYNTQLKEIKGKDFVESIVITQNGEEHEIPADAVFIYVGMTPNTQFLNRKGFLDEDGFVITQENLMTNLEGLYAIGDVRSANQRQIVIAAGEGSKVSLEAYKYIKEKF